MKESKPTLQIYSELQSAYDHFNRGSLKDSFRIHTSLG